MSEKITDLTFHRRRAPLDLVRLGALGLACIPGACFLGVALGLVLALFSAKSRTEG